MLKREQWIKDDLREMEFLGVVVGNDDPKHIGRCRIRVFGKFDDIADDDLPWATPLRGLSFGKDGGSGQFSFPKKDAVVGVRFNNGNIYAPEYYSIQEIATDLKEEITGSYKNSHSLIYDDDEKLRMYYTQQKGVTIYLKESRINIANDNAITIEHKGTSAIIELRGNNITITADSEINLTGGSRIKATAPEVWVDGKETKAGHVPSYSMVLGEPLFAFLKTLASTVDAKLYPTPGAMSSACATAEQLTLSSTCKVSK
jgi:hypothetical protein